MPARRLSEIASLLGLTLRGEDAEVSGINTLEAAGPDEISFLANPKYVQHLALTRACAVIVRPEHAEEVHRALISESPYQDFGRVLHLFAVPQGCFSGISPLAFIHPEARLGKNVTVSPFAFIGAGVVLEDDVQIFPGAYVGERSHIGKGTLLYPNVVLMADTEIGQDCILQPGSVIGGDGFGFARTPDGIDKIPQTGKVRIGNNVEIGANTTIDRAVLDVTHIDDNAKLDNLVQIGHNVHIGRNTLLVSQVGISGSTHIGENCTLAGQVGVAGHLHIGKNVTIGPKSGVPRDVPDNVVVGGIPITDQKNYMRTLALMPRFPELFKRLTRLEKLLEKQTRPLTSSETPETSPEPSDII